MSVASPKTDHWRVLSKWRKHGDSAPGELSIATRARTCVVSAAARTALLVLGATLQERSSGDESVRADLAHGRKHGIFVCWHNRLAGALTYHDRLKRLSPGYALQTIVSASADGEYLARMIRESGGLVIRGSSSNAAAAALRASVEELRRGRNLFTVGDGPRGPRYHLKPGALLLAKLSGLPVYPVTWACTRVLQFHRAWDQMMIPLPFSRIHYRMGEPLHVPADADESALAGLRRDLETRLAALTEWADANTGVAMQVPRPRPGELLKRKAGTPVDAKRL